MKTIKTISDANRKTRTAEDSHEPATVSRHRQRVEGLQGPGEWGLHTRSRRFGLLDVQQRSINQSIKSNIMLNKQMKIGLAAYALIIAVFVALGKLVAIPMLTIGGAVVFGWQAWKSKEVNGYYSKGHSIFAIALTVASIVIVWGLMSQR